MPYIGASNNSEYSFFNLKEKHSIKKSKSDTSKSALSSVYNLSTEDSTVTGSSSGSNDHVNINDDDGLEVEDLDENMNNDVASPVKGYNPSSIPSQVFEKQSIIKPFRSKSIDSISSTITDVDVMELYNLPNESTHSYSYNPLSPNSLAVRLSILKRSLEIIIGNPKMMEVHSNLTSPVLTRKNSQHLRSGTLNMIKTRELRSQSFSSSDRSVNSNKNTNNNHNNNNNNNNRSNSHYQDSRSISSNYPQQEKWTTPTAALNAFVTKSVSSQGGRSDSNNNTNNHYQNLKHRTNSLAFLPRLWNEYDNNINTPKNANELFRRRTSVNLAGRRIPNYRNSNITFRQSFKTGQENVEQNDTQEEYPELEEEKDYDEDTERDIISEQRANLISLLDLLNETLENNTSEKATDLHMLSLFNINKLKLNKELATSSKGVETSSKISREEDLRHSLKLKKALLDSLAEPFYERNVTYEENLINDEESLQRGLDQFIANSEEDLSITDSKAQPDYHRILRTFTSAKNSAPQAIFTCSQQHPWQFKAANDLACLIFGISNNVLKALTLLDLIHADSRAFVIHKILSTESQELVFAGEIVGIIQPGSAKNELFWASFWAKRKNGLLVCVFEKVPCDYVDVLLNLDDFTIENVDNKSSLLIAGQQNLVKHEPAKFELNVDADSDSDSDSELGMFQEIKENSVKNETATRSIIIDNEEKHDHSKKSVKFAQEFHDVRSISNSLAKLIDDVRSGKVMSEGDDLLSMPVRVSNHINELRYFTLNHLSENIPCAVSSSVLENELKLKIHSLPYEAGLFVVDSMNLQLVSFNKSISKNMFGYHFSDLVDESITKIIPSFKSIMDFIAINHPTLDPHFPQNKGMVLTEHFFRKIQAEMNGDIEGFYTSVGIDGRHMDKSLIKVDFQIRVLTTNVMIVWITHSRDVVFEDYKTNPSQLHMLKENELAYLSSSSSSSSSSKKSSAKLSVRSMKDEVKNLSLDSNDTKSSSVSSDGFSDNEKNSYHITTASDVESKSELDLNKKVSNNIQNSYELQDEVLRSKLAKIYTRDKSQFVKDGNFKVDESLIISKISTPASMAGTPGNNGLASRKPSQDIKTMDSQTDFSDLETTFLHTPDGDIGAHKHKTKFSDFVILQKMGEGAYGKVNLCMHKAKRYIVVIKMIFKERILVDTWVRDRKLGTIPSEIQIMATLNKDPHENILRLLDFFEDDDYYYIETPVHGETGCIDLFDLIELKTNMTEFEAKLIFKQVVSGVKHLHDQGIIHRDIKDENVIVDSKGFVKIIDFGSAAYVKSGPFDVFVGTIDYAAPEVLGGDPYAGKPQDIWALGILLYTIVFKENPFYNIDEILEGDLKFNDADNVSDECIDLITVILNRSVQKRIDIDGIYNHDWLVL